jgi:CIC family chloride channel protein
MNRSNLLPIQRLLLRENHIFLALTIIIGILAGLAAVLFTLAIKGTTYLLFGIKPSNLHYMLVPTLMSLVTGFLLAKYFPEARGSGVPQTEAAYHLDQHIPARVAFGKFLTGVLCIGSGHSMGREGPSVQIGAGIASSIGKWFHLSPARARSLIPVASAAALSAAFNTPVAAVLFALEEIMGDMNATLLGSTVVASVASVIVERSILGNNPIFHVPQYHLVHPAELIAYVVLGVIGGVVSLAFCKGLLRLRRVFLQLPARTRIYQPALGGLMIGIILIFFPQVLGVGYEYADQALNGGLLLKTMILLCIAKLVATVISYASGNAGGIFAPSLYLGAMAGGAVGVVVHRWAPFATGDPGAYAMVGMGAVFAGIIRAPMTSVFMIFELTQDYQVFVPLMIANMISFLISRQYQTVPLYRALLQQDHVHLPELGRRLATGTWRAKDVMQTDFKLLAPAMSVEEADKATAANHAKSFLVGEGDLYMGLIRREQLKQALSKGLGSTPISSFITSNQTHVHPDHGLDLVLERLGKSPDILPVVSRNDVRRIEGVITPQTVVQFLQSAWEQQTSSTEDEAMPSSM